MEGASTVAALGRTARHARSGGAAHGRACGELSAARRGISGEPHGSCADFAREERVGERRQTALVNTAGSRIETHLPALRSGEREIPSRAGGYVFAGQHFHLYLIAYGLFRFAHEFFRETPRILGPITGYQLAALAIVGLGAVGFVVRQRQPFREAAASGRSQ